MKKLILLFCLFNFRAQAQDFNYTAKKYTAADGLYVYNCRSIAQDKTGFIWIGTPDGLIQFDGYTFHTFYPEPGNYNSLRTINIHKVYCDRNGNVWITEMNLSKFDPVTEKFTQINNPTISESDLMDDDIFLKLISEDQQGKIWFRYEHYPYLFNLDPKTGKLTKIVVSAIQYHSGKFNILDKKNRLWFDCNIKESLIACIDINEYNKTKKAVYKTYTVGEKEENLQSVMSTHDSKTIVCSNLRTFIFNEEKQQFDPYKELNDFLKANYPNSLLLEIFDDSKGTYWISTSNYGLIFWNPVKDKSGQFKDIISHATLMEDKYGLLWIPTSNGLYSININQKSFENFSYKKGVPEGLDRANLIYEDKKDQLWFGSLSGLYKYDQAKDKWKIYNDDLKELPHVHFNRFMTMTEYTDDNYLFGGVGVNKINFTKNIFEYAHPHDTCNDCTPGWMTWDILYSKHHDEYWIGTRDGLGRIKKGTTDSYTVSFKPSVMPEKFEQFPRDPKDSNSLIGKFIWDLYEDSKGEIWVGTNTGMGRYNRKANNFVNYNYVPLKKDGISSNKISCFYEDSKYRFWIGTECGLNLMDREKGTFKQYFSKDGLAGNRVWGILEDNHARLWMLTSKGFSCFDPETGIFKNYDESDGLSGANLRLGLCKTRNGLFYISTSGGIIRFNPDNIKDNTTPPDVVITGFKLYNKPVAIGQIINGDLVLNQSITRTKNITLSHRNKVLSIEFVGLHYADPKKIKYAYRLDNFDSPDYWNHVSHDRRSANYSNLKAGTYTFHVKACNNDGYWNEAGQTIVLVTILPPWWETLWFRILSILFFIATIAALFIGRIYQVEHQKRVLQKLVDQKTEEIRHKSDVLKEVNSELLEQKEELQQTNALLEERQEEILSQKEEIEHQANELRKANATKDKFFSIIGHDLKNPMYAISSLSQMLDENAVSLSDEQIKNIYKMLSDSSKSVTELLENLLTWARAQAGKVQPSFTQFYLEEIINATIQVVRLHAENKGLKIIADISSVSLVNADKNMITTVIRNLLNNAVKFTAKGNITIHIDKHEGDYKISVIDTGMGMEKSILEKLFFVDSHISTQGTSGETGTGLGLIICKEFVELNKGRIWAESEPGKGSKFIFTLPIV